MLGQERLGEMILAQNSTGSPIVEIRPGWVDQCKPECDWIDIHKETVTQQKCSKEN